MSAIADAYDQWTAQYDTNKNKTHDLEGHALRTLLGGIERPFASALEIGAGTGKNSEFLVTRARQVRVVGLFVRNAGPPPGQGNGQKYQFSVR